MGWGRERGGEEGGMEKREWRREGERWDEGGVEEREGKREERGRGWGVVGMREGRGRGRDVDAISLPLYH